MYFTTFSVQIMSFNCSITQHYVKKIGEYNWTTTILLIFKYFV